MIRRIGYILIAALLLSSCGAKKRRATHRKGAPVVVNNEKSTTRGTSELETGDIRDLYPMPEDTGRFERFPISDTRDYIENFAEIAQYEMRAYGIPASITLAQGILESGSGRGELTLKTNNHFGIKCHAGWEGAVSYTHLTLPTKRIV